MTVSSRPPAVAGMFYPRDAHELNRALDAAFARARTSVAVDAPKALIAPHAGYEYSGAIAASAWATVASRPKVRRVVVLAPAHRAWVQGVASTGTTLLATPLGDVPVDLAALAAVPDIRADASAHAREHAVEVHLPFIQRLFPSAKVVPLVVGAATQEAVAAVLDALWGGDETLVVVSSDLSHYHPYREARALDEATAAEIVALGGPIASSQACGAVAINGLLVLARRRGLRAVLLDLRNSGDTAGSPEEVVGYGAFGFYEGVRDAA